MKRDASARPYGLALGVFTCTACVLPSPLGMVDTDTDTDSGGGSTTGASNSSTSAGDTTGADTTDTSIDQGQPPVGPAAIDILFVFDNSGSMGEEQAALAASIDDLVAALEQIQGISYRIGVTTTDNGNPWCGTTSPEAGKLQLSSCRERQGEFVFNGSQPTDVTAEACTDICTLDSIPVLPTTTHLDTDALPRPWIQGGSDGTNLDGVAIGDALRCVLPQGIAGCGFEQPLASLKKAVQRSEDPLDPQFGFIRPDAHLAVILVTDENDVSYASDFQSIFLPASMGGNQVFWSDTEAAAPTSAVQWNAGVQCTGGPGVYDECHASNRGINGEYDVPDADAVLVPVDTYRDFFAQLLAEKRALADASVFLFGVVGVPPGYPAQALQYADSVDPTEQNDFGIGAGCVSESGTARPPVRERELIESFRYQGMASNLYSICRPPLSDVYSLIVGQLAPYLGG
jgi:hypothetical protein